MNDGIVACVLVYNPGGGLDAVLEAVREQSRPPEAVVVVDNGSEPPIDPSGWPEAWHLLRLDSNTGVGAGHNAGLKWAKAHGFRLAWLLEHDDMPLPECLHSLALHAEDLDSEASRWGVIYPKNLRSREEVQLIGTAQEPADEQVYGQILPPTRGPMLMPAQRFTFNGPLVEVDELLGIGGLREDLFVGHEDWDLSNRLKEGGVQLYYARDTFLVHTNKARRGFRDVSPERMYYSARNGARLRIEAGSPRVEILARALVAGLTWVIRGMPRHGWLRILAAIDAIRGNMGAR